MQIKVPLKYSDVFPDPPPSIDELLIQINKEKLIQATVHLSRHKELENLNVLSFIQEFFPRKSNDFVIKLTQSISTLKRKSINNLTVITKLTCYRLLEKVISMEYRTESVTDFEIIVFKTLLLINEELFTDNEDLSNLVAKGDRISLAKGLFTSSILSHDIYNYNLNIEFMNESYKAIQLFNFLNQDSKLKTTLDKLLQEFECQDSNEYLRLMFATVLPELIDKNKKLHYLSYNRSIETEDKQFRFVEKVALSKYYEIDRLDFIALRSKPLIQFNDSTFLIVSDIFLCQLIHNSLYFKLSDIYNKSELAKSLGIEFRGFYCYEFSEKFLFYKVMDSIFSNKRYSQISGEQFEEQKISGLVDYYIRNGSKILLCESKNALFPARLKNTKDYDVIETILKRNYHSDKVKGKVDKKAVFQLIESIQLILDKKVSEVDSHISSNPRFYPVLISHNKHTDIPGFNLIINDWFQTELEKIQVNYNKKINSQPLTVINIDTLIYFQDEFTEKEFDLYMLIKKYHKLVQLNKNKDVKYRSEKDWVSKIIPFSLFVYNYMNDRSKMKPPKIISEMIEELKAQ